MSGPEDNDPNAAANVFNFRPSIPEECIEYDVYLVQTNPEVDVATELEKVRRSAHELAGELFEDYIWQHDEFTLDLKLRDEEPFLYGRTRIGDSIEDEWAIVYLLRALSKKFPAIGIRLLDEDGDFLLIEAADALPKWLNPEVGGNRGWISKGDLIIIPKYKKSSPSATTTPGVHALEVDDALRWLKENSRDALRLQEVQEAAFSRLRNYPSQIRDNLHRALAVVPRKLAGVLHESPQTIGLAVEAFYLRDPISLRAISRPARDRLVPIDDLVRTSIKFNKVGYAQLKHQLFTAPKAVENSYRGFSGANLNEMEIGMKVTCGFLMLLADVKSQKNLATLKVEDTIRKMDIGEIKLPSNKEISCWGLTKDDESWLDIDFQEFERELSANNVGGNCAEDDGAFGDPEMRERLRRLTKSFQGLLEESSGSESSDDYEDGYDTKDVDDRVDSEGGEDGRTEIWDCEGERPDSLKGKDRCAGHSHEKDIGEDDFTKMMREMLGMPPEVMREIMETGGTGPSQLPISVQR